jgi:hypothetical protein
LNNCKFGGHLNSVRSELFIFDFENWNFFMQNLYYG